LGPSKIHRGQFSLFIFSRRSIRASTFTGGVNLKYKKTEDTREKREIWDYLVLDAEERWDCTNHEYERDWFQFTATSLSFRSLRRESVYLNLNAAGCLEYLRDKGFRERVWSTVNNTRKQIAINLRAKHLENDDISTLSGVNYCCLSYSRLPEHFTLENIHCVYRSAPASLKLSNFRNISILSIDYCRNTDFSQLPPSVLLSLFLQMFHSHS
jgi:hypothetical protein